MVHRPRCSSAPPQRVGATKWWPLCDAGAYGWALNDNYLPISGIFTLKIS